MKIKHGPELKNESEYDMGLCKCDIGLCECDMGLCISIQNKLIAVSWDFLQISTKIN